MHALNNSLTRITFLLCRNTGEGGVGRPCLEVCKEELLSLRQLNYSWTKIARMIGVSRRTLYRRLQDFGIESNSYSDISPSELDEVVRSVKTVKLG